MSMTIHLLGLSLPVLASFPLCDMTEDDLSQNPQFCMLLASLTQHVDPTGLTLPLKAELDKVTPDATGQTLKNEELIIFRRLFFKKLFLKCTV